MPKPIYFSGAATGELSQATLPSPADKYLPLSSMSDTERSQVFGIWLGIVYVNRIPAPARPNAGFSAGDDPILLLDFHQDYEAGAWRKLGRGLTLEETWLASELSLGEQLMCVINSAGPAMPANRIERKAVFDAPTTVDAALAYFRRRAGARRRPIMALVYDGAFGHCITLVDADPAGTRFAFHDPWPGRSLLCEENNAAVSASWLGETKMHFPGGLTKEIELWELRREELAQVLVALMIPMKQWTELTE